MFARALPAFRAARPAFTRAAPRSVRSYAARAGRSGSGAPPGSGSSDPDAFNTGLLVGATALLAYAGSYVAKQRKEYVAPSPPKEEAEEEEAEEEPEAEAEAEVETAEPDVVQQEKADGHMPDPAQAANEGAFNEETGEINWDCPCLGGMAHGPCGEEFKAAFACFVYSEAEPKGIECVDKFKAMQDCFREHPDVYGEEELEEETPVESVLNTEEAHGRSEAGAVEAAKQAGEDKAPVGAVVPDATEKAEKEL